MKVTEIIKALRAGPNGLSQSDIARITGISQSRVSRWESGEVPGSLSDAVALQSLAHAMGVLHRPSPIGLSIGTQGDISTDPSSISGNP